MLGLEAAHLTAHPALVGLAIAQLGIDVCAVQDLTLLHVHGDHLARPQAPLGHHSLRGAVQYPGLR